MRVGTVEAVNVFDGIPVTAEPFTMLLLHQGDPSQNGIKGLAWFNGEAVYWDPVAVVVQPVLPVPAHEFVFRSPALGMERHVCECGTAEWIARCDECDGLCCEDCGGESVYDSDIGKYRWLCWNCAVGK